jgi:predicted esterase
MVEVAPERPQSLFLYFHGAAASGDEIGPFRTILMEALPTTYIWSGDGPISPQPMMRNGMQYSSGTKRFWFAFPMQDTGVAGFQANIEGMGASLATCGAYINVMADQMIAKHHVPSARVVLCGHQHGSCAALAAAMLRKTDPFRMTILLDPFPLESYYLKEEGPLPDTEVVCIDNPWSRSRDLGMLNAKTYEVFESYGMNVRSIHLDQGGSKVDDLMFRAAAECIRKMD